MAGISWPKQVGQGSQTVHRNHISCYASVGLEATVTGGGRSVTVCSVSVSGEEMRGLEEHGALDSWCNQII